MKRKFTTVVIMVILILAIVIYSFTKPINNECVEYSSSEEYKTELIKAIESEDYELTSNLVYSIANSEYYDELDQEVVDDKYNNINPSSDADLLYRGLVSLLDYVDVNEDSSFELIGVDVNNLKDNGIVYYEYELNGISGYYVNNINHYDYNSKYVSNQITIYSSIDECVEDNNDQEYCEGYLYLELANDIYYDDYDKIITNIDYTLVNEDYKNPEQQTIVNYTADAQFYDLVTVVYDLDTIMDEDTPESERDELQMKLIQKANPDVDINNLDDDEQIYYGEILIDGVIDENDQGTNGINIYLYNTYRSANSDGKIDKFIYEDYFNDDGLLDMNRIIEDYNEYEDMFLDIDTDITSYIYQ